MDQDAQNQDLLVQQITEPLGSTGLEMAHSSQDEPRNDSSHDTEDEIQLDEAAKKVQKGPSEKKRRDAALFAAWAASNARSITNKQPGDYVSNKLSLEQVLDKYSKERTISKPREYQIDLFERAKSGNTIVVLDTGMGKTLIAALLLRHILDQELEDRAAGKARKIAFFLVDKVALCFQQHRVLGNNLEHSIAKFYGDMAGLEHKKEYWDRQFSENMVVVCTAQILVQCLSNGFIKMSEINLLVFDEAHHAKKKHPYATIMKSYYMREREDSRPRILGLTASPVDVQSSDMQGAAADMEALLCSTIATVADDALAESQAKRQIVETKETFRELTAPEQCTTSLWDEVSYLVKGNPHFQPHLDFAKGAASTLGKWCADRYWQLLSGETELSRLIALTTRDYGSNLLNSGVSDKETDAVRKLRDLVDQHHFENLQRQSKNHLSTKTRTLWEILQDAFCVRGKRRCIVFVEQRYTAFMLADLFQQDAMQIPGLRASYMIGARNGASGLASTSLLEQVNTLKRFDNGEINCLFATSVAEEGIDIPECDLIIRFDLYKSMIQYIQSRGRARYRDSQYISMVEDGNVMDTRRLLQAARDATALRQFCSSLPANRKVQDDPQWALSMQFEALSQKVHEIPTSGARITFDNSLEILAKFTSSLCTAAKPYVTPEYLVIPMGRNFKAEVILPDSSPIKIMSGKEQRSKQLARSSAAFETCLKLLEKGYINDYLQPMFARKVHALRNARLAVTSAKKAEYPMKLQPEIWSALGEVKELYTSVLALETPDEAGRPSVPLVLLTRSPLPQVLDMPLFFDSGKSTAFVISSSHPVVITPPQLDDLSAFTLKVFADVFSKEYEETGEEMPYFLAPCLDTHEEALKSQNPNQPPGFYVDKFVTDPYDGSRKLVINGINGSLKPSDPTPAGVVRGSRNYELFSDHTIKDYSTSLWRKSRQMVQWRDDQPVVNAEWLPLRRNLLDDINIDPRQIKHCHVILEPLKISSLPTKVVVMALAFPAIVHRINSTLIAYEAYSMLGLTIRPDMVLEALTKDSDNTEEHGQEQIDFQAGMGKNYERLEFIGDTFLKMATTISIFTLLPNADECDAHVERMCLLCNKNLFKHAVERGLQQYIRSKAFDRRTWYPNMKLKKGKAPKTEEWHRLGDKTIADVGEAIIGAAYMTTTTGMTGAETNADMDMAVRAVTQMVRSERHNMSSFKEYYAAHVVPGWQRGPGTAAQRNAVDQLANVIGYRFKCPPLLRSALKHPSYPYEAVPHYQRLEFLGDALLDMAIVDFLFKRFPDANPQWLTEHKMAMVSNQFLGSLCVKLGLPKYILSSTAAIGGSVSAYISDLQLAKAMSAAEAENGEARADFWLHAPHPPKVLADVVEALVGAMFVDSCYDYGVVRRFFRDFIQPSFEDMSSYDSFATRHPVTSLLRKLRHEFGCSDWRLCAIDVPRAADEGVAALSQCDVVGGLLIHGKVVVSVKARGGREAKVAVAKKANEMFGEMEKVSYRHEVACGCENRGGGDDEGDDEDHGTAV